MYVVGLSTLFNFSNGKAPSTNFLFENGSRLKAFFGVLIPNHHEGPLVLKYGCSDTGAKGLSTANSKLHVIDLEKAFYKIYNLKKDNRSCCDLILD